ncbi:MAG: anthranilate phosphoribosyltransferase family protein [Oscillatoriales cyanobacterium RM2_1_1]|nr:anthranilate phosphoribosyltransferase family protein [Oscillatoriales cyanobacterium SM2_3_0]NJO46747.1 anthranilate phosphoribosyltransferase family protein [Oscillatoriales cyanobacterium RM2_1_1]
MSDQFRELLQKVGSGTHTGEHLSRVEAAHAMVMMLRQEATPAQIGAFLIAHRIKRPTGEELAGMLDAFEELGPQLKPINTPPLVLGCPYDGRSRTAPVMPLTALVLATAGVPVILHGGDRMPTKEGIPLIAIWQALGVDWGKLTLGEVQAVLEAVGIGLVYLPHHFPQAHALVSYRREIGKRPPIATMELIWVPYAAEVILACGYVHPPTEAMFQDALARRGVRHFITIKGLEGSCDLPRDRTSIIGVQGLSSHGQTPLEFERILLHPEEYGFAGKEVPLEAPVDLIETIKLVLLGKSGHLTGELTAATLWNAGFYLWQTGVCGDLISGLSMAKSLLLSGQVRDKLEQLAGHF